MKFLFSTLLTLALAFTATAQSAKDDIAAVPGRAGNQAYAYPEANTVFTPTPKGYKPVYMTHYGRHGSRYNWGYDSPYQTLTKAAKAGKLTPLGLQTCEQAKMMWQDAYKREGELTPLGAVQHREIAARMFKNFPEIFADPKTHIDAKSTTVIRCILSMENALQELSEMNHDLTIRHDASEHDMYFMNYNNRQFDSIKQAAKPIHQQFAATKYHPERLMRTLFNDESYWKDSIDAHRLMAELHMLAVHVQDSELRLKFDMLPLFTTDELYDIWQVGNASWYMNHGPSPLTSGKMPYNQSNLLRNMITEADSCLQLPYPSASLRYGHDGMVYPLTCLMGLDGFDRQIEKLEDLAPQDFCDYKMIPMACNIQMIFYRPENGKGDILIKVLRNENEARLPIETSTWPYYKWDEVKKYYLNKLDSFSF